MAQYCLGKISTSGKMDKDKAAEQRNKTDHQQSLITVCGNIFWHNSNFTADLKQRWLWKDQLKVITEGSKSKIGCYQTKWASGLETSRLVLVEITVPQYKDVSDITTSVS